MGTEPNHHEIMKLHDNTNITSQQKV